MSEEIKIQPGERSSTLVVDVPVAKAHARVRISDTTFDAEFERFIRAATKIVETEIHRSLVEATYTRWLDGFPCRDEDGNRKIYLYRPPVSEIAEFQYLPEGEEDMIDVDDELWQADLFSDDPYIMEAPDKSYPDDVSGRLNSVKVTFTCVTADVDDLIKLAIMEIAATMHRARAALTLEEMKQKPGWFHISRQLDPFRRNEL